MPGLTSGAIGAPTARRFPGQRALHVVVRTVHLASGGIVLGAAVFGERAGGWFGVAAATGLLLVADDLYRHRLAWFRYLQAWVVMTKLLLLAVATGSAGVTPWAVWVAVVAGGLISHAPGAIRQRAIWGEDGPCATRHACVPTG